MRTLLFILLIAITFGGCTRPKSNEKRSESGDRAGHHDEPEHEALPKRIRLEPQVISDAKIKTAPATRGTLAAVIDLPGEVASDPDKTAKVSPLVGGRIESVNFKEGQQVKKGDVLALLKVPELGKAKAAYTAKAA